jgi:hypothetical protein
VVVTAGLTDSDPAVAVELVHNAGDVALQLVELVELHVSVEKFPELTEVGLAVRVTVGAVGATTVTVAESLVEPPGPVQVIEYVVVTAGLTDSDPVVAVELVHDALQAVELVELQVSVEEFPGLTPVGLAVKVTVGGVGVVQSSAQLILFSPRPGSQIPLLLQP